jgi:UDP-N-acetyl-D-mannosaminuronic acid transferase (WecB/TagA/CpsF family)
MKKPKFIFKVNHNNTAKVYANKKWQKYVSEIHIDGYPMDYNIEIKQHKLKNGVPYVENNDVASKTTKIHYGN